MLTVDDELSEVFRTESAAIVNDLGRALLALENEGAGGTAQAEAYRHFHTLKGMANMAGLTAVADLCHEAEAALAPGQHPPVDFLFYRLDEVARLLKEGPAEVEDPAADDHRFVSVDVRRLDALLNLAGELAVAETRLGYEARSRAAGPTPEALARVRQLVRALQDEVMRARLIPVRTLFSRLPRLARDAAKAAGKEVHVDADDAGLELDRAVVERAMGALAHLVQNAVAHGVEPPDERARVGKKRVGVVKVRARQENEMVVLEVEDDGRGVDPAKIAERALERGLVAAEEAREMTLEGALRLLALPGFSTAKTADRVAGRGVGLTAALDVARQLGGSLAIDSLRGEGTTVRVRLPPSVAVLDTLLAESGGTTVALPLRAIERIVPGSRVREVAGVPSILHDGAATPVVDLAGKPVRPGPRSFVIVARGGARGVAVDRVVGTHAAIVKPLDATLAGDVDALGATVLGSGDLALVLELDSERGGNAS